MKKRNNITKGLALAAAALLTAGAAQSQGLENVIVEKYYVSDANDATDTDGGNLPVGSVTYRIYIDMAPGYQFLSMYGSPEHELRFETTTLFFNNEDRGGVSPNGINTNFLSSNTVMVDSWLGAGAGSSTLWAVPKSEDNNGAIQNIDGFLQNNDPSAGFPLTQRDGLIPGPGAPPVAVYVPGVSTFNVFNDINDGPVFTTNNAAWAVLAGTQGATASNTVCIAQITTNGDFSFELNVQLKSPNGGDERYVARNPVGNEQVFAGLIYSSVPTCNVAAGTVSTSSPRFNLCIGDGFPNIVQLAVTGNTSPGRFGLVRQSDLAVIATNGSGTFNMENFPPGNYFAGYVAVESLQQLNGVTNVNQLTGCFEISNQLTITSVPVNGGVITANGPTSGCISTIGFSVTGQQGSTFRWALLNSNGTQVIASNATGVFDLSNLPNGVYRVVHIASRGVNFNSITPPNLPACTEGSNIIQVTKNCPAAFTSQPNPTTGTSWATFSVGNDALTTLEVYDVSGRKVAEIFRQNAQAEVEYRVEFDGSNLPNGVYLYRLTTGSEVIVDKFMIAR